MPPHTHTETHKHTRTHTTRAGPFFKGVDHLDFYNLELADTNVTDHNTHK